MRVLFITRGIPGCGKSTFIKNHNLEQYKICADEIRLLKQSPVMTIDGGMGISQSNDSKVWNFLFDTVKERMSRGEFIIVDSTNTKTSDINKYKSLCKDYKYSLYVLDFSDIPLNVCEERNKLREEYKVVPTDVIKRMHSRLKTEGIPSGVKVVKPEDFDEVFNNLYKEIDLSNYKKIHHIGDIHGCNTVLQEYLKDGLKDDECYIFLGDYTDRGIENTGVLKFLLTVYKKPNVMMLTGNHERHVLDYLKGKDSISEDFNKNTKVEIELSDIDRRELKDMYKGLLQAVYYTYKGKTVLVSHGGVSNIIKPLILISTEQFIKGVGKYGDMEMVNESFLKNTEENFYQIHGHRNIQGAEIQVNDRCFNLCDEVEFGGFLRVLTLDDIGFTPIKIKNNIFKKTELNNVSNSTLDNMEISDLVSVLRNNDYIKEKPQGNNISSFNFSRKAFYDSVWNDITIKTRGLYINTKTNEIVAKGYTKFFNVEEREETNIESLKNNMKFPARAWLKYNGFLGLVGYDRDTDNLVIATKSSMTGDYSEMFKDILKELNVNMEELKNIVKDNNLSLVFEVVDKDRDPHIIKYNKNSLILLDAFYRNIKEEKVAVNELCRIARAINVDVKELCKTFNNWEEFIGWYNIVMEDDYQYNGDYIEGFVLEDSSGFNFKLKLSYYRLWKTMRTAKEILKKHDNLGNKIDFDSVIGDEFCRFLLRIKSIKPEILEKDIVQLRESFFSGYIPLK